MARWIRIPLERERRRKCGRRALESIPWRSPACVTLDQLKAGRNIFQFTAGPQLCYSFNWGFYWVYEFTVRVYYNPPAEVPGRIVAPVDRATIGENPRIAAEAWKSATPIIQVDFIGEYDDFNWEGDGVSRQWHYIVERGQLRRHLGTAMKAPHEINWDTAWVPDQDQPVKIAARILDADGLIYITRPVTASFRRSGRSVKLWKAAEIPEAFGVRVGRRKECTIDLGGDVKKARAARLVLSTWSAAHADEIGLNGRKLVDRIGLVHNYSFDSIPIPLDVLRPGANVFHIFSKTEEHAAEVNWPGLALLVEYGE